MECDILPVISMKFNDGVQASFLFIKSINRFAGTQRVRLVRSLIMVLANSASADDTVLARASVDCIKIENKVITPPPFKKGNLGTGTESPHFFFVCQTGIESLALGRCFDLDHAHKFLVFVVKYTTKRYRYSGKHFLCDTYSGK